MTQIWEHEFNDLIRENEELKQFKNWRFRYYKPIESVGHISIDDAFFGGRTNNLFFNYVCNEDEKIIYQDVTSLYPYVLVKNAYPIGHPEVFTEFYDKNISGYFGFVKCKVLPPQDLYIPVLPMRDEKKRLLFPLCEVCAETKPAECHHSEEERCLIGTWFTGELNKAIEKGYIIKKIYEVLHYKERSKDIFKEYVQKWLKLKTEASGWPSNRNTPEEKEAYIQEFMEREGM